MKPEVNPKKTRNIMTEVTQLLLLLRLDIIKSVERLTDIWATQIQLNSNMGNITTDVIRYLCGVI